VLYGLHGVVHHYLGPAADLGRRRRLVSEAAGASDRERASGAPQGRRLFLLSLGRCGVVFGDIGTSPLYALRECFHGEYAVDVTQPTCSGSCRSFSGRSCS
jgi:hypothetical protein